MTNKLRDLISDLDSAKGRRLSGLFKAEGAKCVCDTLGHFTLRHLFTTEDFRQQLPETFQDKAETVSRADMQKMAAQITTPPVIAVYEIPSLGTPDISHGLTLALDCIQDPGNLGTIIRTCDWMGVSTILASQDTADCWSPKVIQATMGAISRVKVHYCDLPHTLASAGVPLIGTFLDGENIYTADLGHKAAIVIMGNEGRGISAPVAQLIDRRILIPSYPAGRPTSESLNVATATAITLSQIRARQFQNQ